MRGLLTYIMYKCISSFFTCRPSIVQLDIQLGIILTHHFNRPQIRADVLCIDEVFF